jgi:hypothetical protein
MEDPATDRLAVLVGEWRMVAHFKDAPPTDDAARVVFEWMPEQRFLIQRWELPSPVPPGAPAAGIAIIGADPDSEGNFLQHYFDSRGVARVYEMSLSDGVWKLWRDAPDFAQRFSGTFGDDGTSITGSWEICHDGTNWEHDFDLTYTKVT